MIRFSQTITNGLFERPTFGGTAAPLPVVDSIDVATIVTGASETVVITGSNFVDVTGVTFGEITVDSYVVDSDTQITAEITAGEIIEVVPNNVEVTTATGASALLNAITVTYHAKAIAYFNELTIGSLSPAQLKYYNRLIVRAHDQGWYNKMIQMLPNQGGSEANAAIDQIAPRTVTTIFMNAPAIDAKIGVTWDGLTQYAKLGKIPSAVFVDPYNWQVGVFCLVAATGGNQNVLGAQNGGSLILLKTTYPGGTATIYGNTSVRSVSSTTSHANNQMIQGIKQSNSILNISIDGVIEAVDSNIDGGASPTFEFYYGCKNSSGSAQQFTDGKFCFPYIAQNLTDADQLNISNEIKAYYAEI